MVFDLFKKSKYFTVRQDAKRDIPEGLWVKCEQCRGVLFSKDLERNLKVCSKCGYHFRLTAEERLGTILDQGSFTEYDPDFAARDPLGFPSYQEKLEATRENTGLREAVLTGEGLIAGRRVVIVVMDSHFIMGSMSTAVGEKITRAVDAAREKHLPLIIVTASGGARMQEGMPALMQMTKTSMAVGRYARSRLPYISVLTDPTMGGVTASFAFLADIILAEPGALIGFAGPRVIEQTIRQKLPEGFQRAEYLLEHGFVDDVVPRPRLAELLGRLIALHEGGNA